MNNNINVKKLVTKTLSSYGISGITEASLKRMIAGEGYTIIRFSSMTSTGETQRLLETLYLDEISKYENSFTYNDRERRIVFIRRDVSDDEFLYLLSHELGKIVTFSTSSGGIIGTTAEEIHLANEFAHHVIDIRKHGLIYNYFKYYPVQSVFSLVAFIVCISLALSLFVFKSPMANKSLFKDQTDISNVLEISSSPSVPDNSEGTIDDSITPTDYLATRSGSKYHTAECSFVKGKDAKVVAAEDIASGKYTPCSRCIK